MIIYLLLLPVFLLALLFAWFLIDTLFINPDPEMWILVFIFLALIGVLLFLKYK